MSKNSSGRGPSHETDQEDAQRLPDAGTADASGLLQSPWRWYQELFLDCQARDYVVRTRALEAPTGHPYLGVPTPAMHAGIYDANGGFFSSEDRHCVGLRTILRNVEYLLKHPEGLGAQTICKRMPASVRVP